MTVTNTSLDLMNVLQGNFGGIVRKERQRWIKSDGAIYKEIYTWRIRSFKYGTGILRGINPFLVIKKDKGDALIKVCDFYYKILGEPLKKVRKDRNQFVKKRLPNQGTKVLLSFLIDNWFSKFYKKEESISYQKALGLLNTNYLA